jgi:hypothetical protein
MLDLTLVKFLINQRIKPFDVSDQPHLDAESASYFISRLSDATVFLEYGAGGSTVEAARQNKQFVTVESDPFFLASVRKKVGNAGKLLHADIGLTGPWGTPLIKTPNPSRLKRWAKYPMAPLADDPDFTPDLILIDGRFRVLCALTVIDRLCGRDFELLFDDYAERRDHFRAVEQFADLTMFKGGMAIFRPKVFHQSDIIAAKNEFVADFG